LDRLSAHLQSLAPELLAAPVAAIVENIASSNPGYVAYYSPGVLALLLQHIAITLAALSFVRGCTRWRQSRRSRSSFSLSALAVGIMQILGRDFPVSPSR
jgi:hypothetical protein